MRRMFSFKSLLIVLVVVVIGLFLLMSRSAFPLISKSEDSMGFLSQDDSEFHYYSNPKKQKSSFHQEPSKKNDVIDYPFDEQEETDFDPLAVPGDEDRKARDRKSFGAISGRGNQPSGQGTSTMLRGITCDINNSRYRINCKKGDNDEVYVPFSFLRKYYEVYGKISETKSDTFIWNHTPPIKIYRPNEYESKGVFGFFANYNVEVRERVKCISGSRGVPVSTQWDANGYYYPIQIAQFGLSHYSKYILEKTPKRTVVDNGRNIRGNWIMEESGKPAVLRTVPDPDNPSNQVIAIKPGNGNSLESVTLPLHIFQPHLLFLSLQIRSDQKSSTSRTNVTITVKASFESQEYYLHYVTEDFFIKVQDNHIYHGLGLKSEGHWQHIIRDIGVDIQKGVGMLGSTNLKKVKMVKIPRSRISIESLTITNMNPYGIPLLIDNLTLSSSEHLAQFFQAVDWFVTNQDSQGGWPIPVPRKFSQSFLTLKAGWHSAMGQGHGLSLLSRAFFITKDVKYADACERALNSIFDHGGKDNLGVKAVFLDQFSWYEEYPTTPSSFVLNGFMYALLGLYDVFTLKIPGAAVKAQALYSDGIRSLIKMLPLYDTGSGTFYDLRHFTVPGISPNLARLDYHVTHINQLLIFSKISEDPIFKLTAARWIRYTEGEKASHN